MKGMVPLDPQSDVSQTQYAVVFVPRKSRKRFAASCVDLKVSRESAIQQASEKDKKYAAVVIGPSKSSEGQYIYYLSEWL